MTRLALRRIRVCSRCGRGRAELEGRGGERLEIVLDAPRAADLSQRGDDVQVLSTVVLDLLAGSGARPADVVLDLGPAGMRALLSVARDGADVEAVACTAQEGLELAVKGDLPLYASDEVLRDAATPPDAAGHTLH